MMADDKEAPDEKAASPEGARPGEEREYPPETYVFMSWSAVKFIHRPSLRPLAWACHGLMAIVFAAFFSSFFLRLDVRVESPGEIVADPGVLQVVAKSEALMNKPRVQAGAAVSKGEVLGTLQMELDEGRAEEILAALDQNAALLEPVNRKTSLSARAESGQALSDIREDAALREAATALQAALRRLRESLTGLGPFEADKGEAIRASRQLRGVFSEYLESHRLRSPADGTVLQYEVQTNANVKRGQIVATILPKGADLVAKLILEANDVPNVKAGQRVRHKVEAYPFQRYGLFEGTVSSIERAGGGQGGLRYEVRATVKNPTAISRRLSGDIRLVMGMKLSSQIITGNRALYDIAVDGLFGKR